MKVVTNESWFSRMGKAIGGVIAGIVLFIASFPFLWWNEGRAVQTIRSLNEGAAAVIAVEQPENGNQDALVHTTNTATTDETLNDAVFGVQRNALRLVRDVEMYQWEEDSESVTRKKLGGGEETVTEYSYAATWSGREIDSSDFADTSYVNPEMRYESRTFDAQNATLGDFDLPESLVRKISGKEQIILEEIDAKFAGRETSAQLSTTGAIYLGADPLSPSIGDIRITFYSVDPQIVSVIAAQDGTSFAPYQTKAGDKIYMLSAGTVSAEDMFTQAQDANRILTWILRVVGFFMMFMGMQLIFRIIPVIGDVIPFIGSLLGAGITLISGLVAIIGSSFTIGLAWVFFRPMVGIPLLVITVAGVYYLFKLRNDRKAVESEAA